MDLTKMRFNIAAAGFSETDTNNTELYRKISRILVELRVRIGDFNTQQYGYTGEEAEIRLLSGPMLSDRAWEKIARENELVFMEYPRQEEGTEICEADRRAEEASWLSDQADLILLIWNEHMDSAGSAAWEMLRIGRQKRIPCVWVSTREDMRAYWSETSYFEPYRSETMKRFCSEILPEEVSLDQEQAKRVPFLALGAQLYDCFMKKHKAKGASAPYEADALLAKEAQFPEQPEAEGARRSLMEAFGVYDSEAGRLAQNYHAAIYFRSILPFLTTIFLAIGFYTETLMGYWIPLSVGGLNFWMLLAGVGFLIHALLNLYAFYLSGNKQIQRWHAGFLYNRFMAELMRILIHFLPFGVPLNVKSILNQCGGLPGGDNRLYVKIRKLVRAQDQPSLVFGQEMARDLLGRFSMLIDDQARYQKDGANRYRSVVTSLKKLGKVFFYIGFVLVILRGLMQFMIGYADLDKNLAGYIRSFANMLALFLPAYASYFTSKLSLCGFEDRLRECGAMTGRLEEAKRLVQDAVCRDFIPFDLLRSVTDEVAVLLLGDVSRWYGQTASKKVTRL